MSYIYDHQTGQYIPGPHGPWRHPYPAADPSPVGNQKPKPSTCEALQVAQDVIALTNNLKNLVNPPSSASEVAAKEAAKTEEAEKRRKDEEELHRLRKETEERKIKQSWQADLAGMKGEVLGRVDALTKVVGDRERKDELAVVRSEGKSEGRAEGIKEEQERYWSGRGRDRRPRRDSVDYRRGSSLDRSRSRSRHRMRGGNGGGGGWNGGWGWNGGGNGGGNGNGSGGAIGPGYGHWYGQGNWTSPAGVQLNIRVGRSRSPSISRLSKQGLIQSSPAYNVLQHNQSSLLPITATQPLSANTSIAHMPQFVSGQLAQVGQNQQTAMDRLERVDAKMIQGQQNVMDRFTCIDHNLGVMDERNRMRFEAIYRKLPN